MRAATELRGFGDTFVVVTHRPSPLRLTEADVAGVHVVMAGETAGEILVRGQRIRREPQQRMVATRYWEERLYAHALRMGMLTR